MEVVTSLSEGRTAAAQCGLFTYKSVAVIFQPPCIFFPLAGLERRVTQIFLLFLCNCCFFLYRLSDLEVSCLNGPKSRHLKFVVACGP